MTEPPDCPSFAAGADDVAEGDGAAAEVAPELAPDEAIPVGTVAEAARRLGVRRWHVSLTHDGGFSVAFVVAES